MSSFKTQVFFYRRYSEFVYSTPNGGHYARKCSGTKFDTLGTITSNIALWRESCYLIKALYYREGMNSNADQESKAEAGSNDWTCHWFYSGFYNSVAINYGSVISVVSFSKCEVDFHFLGYRKRMDMDLYRCFKISNSIQLETIFLRSRFCCSINSDWSSKETIRFVFCLNRTFDCARMAIVQCSMKFMLN